MTEAMLEGLAIAFSWPSPMYLLLGILMGIWIGAVPGLGGAVLHDIDPQLPTGALGQMVEQELIHIGAAELGIAAGRPDLEHPLAELHDGHV